MRRKPFDPGVKCAPKSVLHKQQIEEIGPDLLDLDLDDNPRINS
jgi:hypothetical protein